MYKYIFTPGSHDRINNALCDDISESYRDKLLSTISELCETEEVAKAFDIYIKQAILRECQYTPCQNKLKNKNVSGMTENVA